MHVRDKETDVAVDVVKIEDKWFEDGKHADVPKGVEIDKVNRCVFFGPPERRRVASIGDYVVVDKDGDLDVCHAAAFEARFDAKHEKKHAGPTTHVSDMPHAKTKH